MSCKQRYSQHSCPGPGTCQWVGPGLAGLPGGGGAGGAIGAGGHKGEAGGREGEDKGKGKEK